MLMIDKQRQKRFAICTFITLTLLAAGCSGPNDAPDQSGSQIVPVNEAPVAVDDTFSVVRGSSASLNLMHNDTDAENDLNPASISIITLPNHGSVVVDSTGKVNYTHDDGVSITDGFTYTIEDNNAAASNIASVSLVITPAINPVAVEAGIYNSTVVEGADDLEFVISLSSPGTATVSLDYATKNVTAIAGTDYSFTQGTVQFASGEVRKFIPVNVLDNPAPATVTSRSLQLVLSNPQNAVLINSTATGTIIDRDAMSTDNLYDHDWGQAGAFTSASTCGASCHKASSPKMLFNGQDISPGTQWRHSVMANAFVDPYWQAAVEDEVDSYPQLSGFIEDTCTKCHAPMGRTHAHQSVSNLDSDNFYRMQIAHNEMHAREGVSCTICHQVELSNLGDAASFSGGYKIPYSVSPDYKKIVGPYGSPVGNNMFMQTGHRPVEGDYISASELCATCHTLYTPTLDPESGIPTGSLFLEQGPYLEWKNSHFATGEAREAQCQDCHMPQPQAGYATPISLLPFSAPERTPYGQHLLTGGNAHLLEILRDYRAELGISGSTSITGFNDQIELTRNFLSTAASVTISPPQTVANTLQFDVEIQNQTGHKLPSAYPSRRMWLHVSVRDSSNTIIFESGKPDSRGYISTDEARLKADCMSAHKLQGFDSTPCFELHRDTINHPSQVAIYETVLGDVNGNITHTLLQGYNYIKDNRIPPAGFTNARASLIEPQTIPAGINSDPDFNCVSSSEGCGMDSVHFQVDVSSRTGPFDIQARLLYQATQPGFVDGMHNIGDRVNRFKIMYHKIPSSVEILATAIK